MDGRDFIVVCVLIAAALALGVFFGHSAAENGAQRQVCAQLKFVKLSPSDSTWMQATQHCGDLK